MQIVTITCKDDFGLLLYQLRSMDRFLEPCTVNVVINETENIIDYKTQIKSTVHKIKIWTQYDILQMPAPNDHGWCSQQLLKMLIPIDDDYISLDCKDMFIKPTTLSMLTKRQRRLGVHPGKKDPCHNWPKFYNTMTKHLWKHYKTRVNVTDIDNIQTPRVIKKHVVNKIPDIWGSNKKFINWWGQFGMPSEFIMYDCIQQLEQKDQMNKFKKDQIVAVWYKEDIDFNAIKDNTFMLKIHRRVYNDPKTQKIVTDWIENLLTTA